MYIQAEPKKNDCSVLQQKHFRLVNFEWEGNEMNASPDTHTQCSLCRH